MGIYSHGQFDHVRKGVLEILGSEDAQIYLISLKNIGYISNKECAQWLHWVWINL